MQDSELLGVAVAMGAALLVVFLGLNGNLDASTLRADLHRLSDHLRAVTQAVGAALPI